MSIEKPIAGALDVTSCNFLKHDGPAGIVTFLVALPLCLGIALGSAAPMFAGVIAGIVGGMVVSLLSRLQVSVSGPAAGLAIIVLGAIQEIGSFQGFLVAVVLSGLLQLVFGVMRLGVMSPTRSSKACLQGSAF
jgi:carbonic anhydrase